MLCRHRQRRGHTKTSVGGDAEPRGPWGCGEHTRAPPAHAGSRDRDTHHKHVLQQLQVSIGALFAKAQRSLPHIPAHLWVVGGFLKPGDRESSVHIQHHPRQHPQTRAGPTLQARSISAIARRLRLAVAMTSSCRQELPAATALAVAIVMPFVMRMKSSGVETLAGGTGEEKTYEETGGGEAQRRQ